MQLKGAKFHPLRASEHGIVGLMVLALAPWRSKGVAKPSSMVKESHCGQVRRMPQHGGLNRPLYEATKVKPELLETPRFWRCQSSGIFTEKSGRGGVEPALDSTVWRSHDSCKAGASSALWQQTRRSWIWSLSCWGSILPWLVFPYYVSFLPICILYFCMLEIHSLL